MGGGDSVREKQRERGLPALDDELSLPSSILRFCTPPDATGVVALPYAKALALAKNEEPSTTAQPTCAWVREIPNPDSATYLYELHVGAVRKPVKLCSRAMHTLVSAGLVIVVTPSAPAPARGAARYGSRLRATTSTSSSYPASSAAGADVLQQHRAQLKDLESRVEMLKTVVEGKDEKIAVLEEEAQGFVINANKVQMLTRMLEESHRATADLEHALKDAREKAVTITAQHEGLVAEYDSVRDAMAAENRALEEQLGAKDVEITRLQSLIAELEQSLVQLRCKVDEAEHAMMMAMEEAGSANARVAECQGQMRQLEAEKSTLLHEKEAVVAELAGAQGDVEAACEGLVRKDEEICKAEGEIAALVRKVEEVTSKADAAETRAGGLKEKLTAALMSHAEREAGLLEQMREKDEEIQRTTTALDATRSCVEELTTSLMMTLEENATLQGQLARAHTQLDGRLRELIAARDARSRLERLVMKAEEDRKSLDDRYGSQGSELQAELQAANARIRDLQASLTVGSEQMDELQAAVEELKAMLKEREGECGRLLGTITDLEANLMYSDNERRTAEEEVATCRQALEEMKTMIEEGAEREMQIRDETASLIQAIKEDADRRVAEARSEAGEWITVGEGEDGGDDDSSGAAQELKELREEVEKLRTENASLREKASA